MVVSYIQHHPHHHQQGQPPHHIQQHSRPPSIVHQQQHHPPGPQQQAQHPTAYPSSHNIAPVYQQQTQQNSGQHTQEIPYYPHPSPYSTPGATGGYTSAGESFPVPAGGESRQADRSSRHFRDDDRNDAETTIPANVVPYAAVKFASLGGFSVGTRSARQHLWTAGIADAPAADVLWTTTVRVDAPASSPFPIWPAYFAIPPTPNITAQHDVSLRTVIPDGAASEPARSASCWSTGLATRFPERLS